MYVAVPHEFSKKNMNTLHNSTWHIAYIHTSKHDIRATYVDATMPFDASQGKASSLMTLAASSSQTHIDLSMWWSDQAMTGELRKCFCKWSIFCRRIISDEALPWRGFLDFLAIPVKLRYKADPLGPTRDLTLARWALCIHVTALLSTVRKGDTVTARVTLWASSLAIFRYTSLPNRIVLCPILHVSTSGSAVTSEHLTSGFKLAIKGMGEA